MYSYARASIAYQEQDNKRMWVSLANSVEGAVRDVLIITNINEAVPIMLAHSMAESLTDKLADIFTNTGPEKPKVTVQASTVDKKTVVLIGGSQEYSEQSAKQLFDAKSKGVHYFFASRFVGRIVHGEYAPDGETFWLDMPRGLYDGARINFFWTWTKDAAGVKNRPDSTSGLVKLIPGKPTQFELLDEGMFGYYSFIGEITSADKIRIDVVNSNIEHFELKRWG